MRTLILLRHAKSDYPPRVPDHDRPLSARGRRNAATIGDQLRAVIPAEATIGAAVSTAERTQQTWQLVEADLGKPDQRWNDSALYLAEPDAIAEVSRCFDSDVGIIVGHNPGLEELALSIPERRAAAADIAIKFPTSAFAVIEIDGEDWNWTPADARVSAFAICR